MRRTAFCIYENKGADQLRDNRRKYGPSLFKESTVSLFSKKVQNMNKGNKKGKNIPSPALFQLLHVV